MRYDVHATITSTFTYTIDAESMDEAHQEALRALGDHKPEKIQHEFEIEKGVEGVGR